MNQDFIKRLYWACTDRDGADADGTRLFELYERTEEVKKVDHTFSEKLFATGLSDDEKRLLENIDASVAMAYEMQGFLNGFRLGMKLAGELREAVDYG